MSARPLPAAEATLRHRLAERHLDRLPDAIARPGYDRARLPIGVVHLGIGAFHRAHQAVFLEALLHRRFGPHGLVGVSLRHAAVRDALAPQNGLYTLVVRDGAQVDYRVIGCVKAALAAPDDPEAVLRHLTNPATRMVTLTVTEKGYCLAPDGRLDPRHPDIAHDLAARSAPRTAIGFLVEALRRIRAAGTPPPTLLSCDNLPSNGRTLRRALVGFAALSDDRLARWIESEAAIPCTMIDRIVPATIEADLAEVSAALGLEDRAAVVTEPFSQWAIEDSFAAGMPALAEVGVEIVPDVAPYERMKLRLLNGSHSTIAYLGQLAGYTYVTEAVADPVLRRFIQRMMAEEIAPTLKEFSAARLGAYAAEVIRRFENRAIRHRTWQIAMDGSQKLPQRLLATIEHRLREGASIDRLALAVAAWMRFLGGASDQGDPIEVSDPRAGELTRWADARQSDAEIVANLLERSGIFPPLLASNATFRSGLTAALAELRRLGAREVLRSPRYGGP